MPQIWPLQPPQAGVTAVTSDALTHITFKAPFAAPPVVVATVVASRRTATAQNVTPTGFDSIVEGPGTYNVAWTATPAS